MSPVERRVRALLHAYPPAWRRAHGGALLGTLLDAADARAGRGPTRAEALDLIRRGLLARLRMLLPSAATRELGGRLALATGTALALSCFVLGEWEPWLPAGGWRVEPGHLGPFATAGVLSYACWAVAFGATVLGQVRVARVALLGSIATAVMISGGRLLRYPVQALVTDPSFGGRAADAGGPLRSVPAVLLAVLIPLAILALLGQHGRAATRSLPSGRVSLVLGTSALTALLVLAVLPWPADRPWTQNAPYWFYRVGGLPSLWLALGELVPVALLAGLVTLRWRSHWLPAVLLWCGALLVVAPVPAAVESAVMRAAGRMLGQPPLVPAQQAHFVELALLAVTLIVAVRQRWRVGVPASRG